MLWEGCQIIQGVYGELNASADADAADAGTADADAGYVDVAGDADVAGDVDAGYVDVAV